jgi:hypothetical protein
MMGVFTLTLLAIGLFANKRAFSARSPLLVRGLSSRVPGGQRRWVRKSTKKRQRSEAQGNLGRLAKYRRPCRHWELGPGQDPRDRSGNSRGVTGKRTKLSISIRMARAMDSDGKGRGRCSKWNLTILRPGRFIFRISTRTHQVVGSRPR